MRIITWFIYFFLLIISFGCDKKDNAGITGCTFQYATNYDPKATKDCNCCDFKKGDVVFWVADASFISDCGYERSITLTEGKTGQEMTGIKYVIKEPSKCDSTQEGHISVNVGKYNYTLTGDFLCDNAISGTVVIEEGCNKVELTTY
jgi:hypothetical protein